MMLVQALMRHRGNGFKWQAIMRPFTTQLNPVKPGRLSIKGNIANINIEPAFTNEDLSCSITQVNLLSQTLSDERLNEVQKYVDRHISLSELPDEIVLNLCLPPDEALKDVTMLVKIPHHYNVDLVSYSEGCVKLNSLESDSLVVTMADGNCELHKMKALDCRVKGESANLLLSKPFVGNLSVDIKAGSVMGEKVQGQNIDLSIGSGNINLHALYSAKASLRSNHGDICIGNCHGTTNLSVGQGNVNINSLDGRLNARCTQGDIHVHLTDFSEVQLDTQGTADVTLSEHTVSAAKLQTNELDLDDTLVFDIDSRDAHSSTMRGILGELQDESAAPVRNLEITAGAVRVSKMDWITAQKLLMSSDD